MSKFQKQPKGYQISEIQNIASFAKSNQLGSFNGYLTKYKKGGSGMTKSKVSDEQEDRKSKNDRSRVRGQQQYKQHESKKNSKNSSKDNNRRGKMEYIHNQEHQNQVVTNRSFQNLMAQTDNSMEEMLNSSINQFSKYLEDKDNIQLENACLIQQNSYLKNALEKLKNIIKEKLESALKKQKQELTFMLEDYIKLITKLLKDKQDLTMRMEELQLECNSKDKKCQVLEKEHREGQRRVQEIRREKDGEIRKIKGQIQEFLVIIQQYESDIEEESQESNQMKKKIYHLEEEVIRYKNQPQQQYENLSTSSFHSKKNQDLIELLEKAQQQNKMLRNSLKKDMQVNQQIQKIRDYYEEKLDEVEKQHQEEFIEYQRAIKQTIEKKNQCIQRLTCVVGELRSQREEGEWIGQAG